MECPVLNRWTATWTSDQWSPAGHQSGHSNLGPWEMPDASWWYQTHSIKTNHPSEGKKKNPQSIKATRLPARGNFRFSLSNCFVLRETILCATFCAAATSPPSKTKHGDFTGSISLATNEDFLLFFPPHTLSYTCRTNLNFSKSALYPCFLFIYLFV